MLKCSLSAGEVRAMLRSIALNPTSPSTYINWYGGGSLKPPAQLLSDYV